MNGLVSYVQTHKVEIAAVISAFSYFCTTIIAAVPVERMPKWLSVFLGWAGSLAPADKKGLLGRFTPPFIHVPLAPRHIGSDDITNPGKKVS